MSTRTDVERVEVQPNISGTYAAIQRWGYVPLEVRLGYERARSEALAATGLVTFAVKFEALLVAKDALLDAELER